MAVKLKELAAKPGPLTGGHRACAGCVSANVIRQVLLACDYPVVCGCATGCIEVVTTIYPYSAWNVPYIHCAFENVAATISGVESAYRALKKRGKIKDEIKFIAFGGDGGTYDIGIQSLSGALERGHDFVYVCYDNEAYMNTGIQRSGATPFAAATSTSPAGKVIPGKREFAKDLTAIVAAHHIPYAAQASAHNWKDLVEKVRKALSVNGPAFLNILAPCFRGWRFPAEDGVKLARLAVECKFWPLFEVENDEWKINYRPKEEYSVIDWMRLQGRFKHLFDGKHDEILDSIEQEVDRRWKNLLALSGES